MPDYNTSISYNSAAEYFLKSISTNMFNPKTYLNLLAKEIKKSNNPYSTYTNTTKKTSTHKKSTQRTYNTSRISTSTKKTTPISFSTTSRSLYSSSLNLNFGDSIANIANSYQGFNESNGSFKLFTNGRNEAWCADFVTYVVKQAAKEKGIKLPSGFGSSSVSALREWGKRNNCYLQTSHLSNKNSVISSKVKKGDIIIFKNGVSHTGIVSKVENGKIYTIEGNTSDRVASRVYSVNDSRISGFVQIA